MIVESYADRAVARWQRLGYLPGRAAWNSPHAPSFCGCLACADGREATGQPPLLPVFARLRVEEARP